MKKYEDIFNKFSTNYINCERDQRKKYLYEAVNNIKLLSNDDEHLFDFFCDVLENCIQGIIVMELTLEEFKYMLELGVDVSYDPIRIFTSVSFYNEPDIALYLLDNNYVDMADIVADKSAISQCLQGNIKVAELILQQGISQEILSEAMIWFPLDINKLNLLVEYGADLGLLMDHLVSDGSIHPKKHIRVIKFILETMESKKLDSYYNPKIITKLLNLYIQIFGNDVSLAIIKMLIDRGANPKKEPMIFLYACQYIKNREIILYLVNEHGYDINMEKSRALSYAILGDNYDIFVLLLELGINVTDNCLCTIYTEYLDQPKYTDLLINHGVSPERIAKQFISGDKKLLKYLLESGVDFNELIANL